MITLPSGWQNSRIYDMAMRLPIVSITVYFCWRELMGLRAFVVAHPFFEGDWTFLTGLFARIGVLVFLCFLASFHFTRRRPVLKYEKWQPKLAALLGAGMTYLVLLLPLAKHDIGFDLASSILTFFGSYLCLVSVTSLGRSLSIMPEARALVTSGLYKYIRHPLYMAELVALVGFFMQYRSWAAAAILAVVLFFQLKRMDWEEQILAQAFPEYESYRLRSWRLFPGLY